MNQELELEKQKRQKLETGIKDYIETLKVKNKLLHDEISRTEHEDSRVSLIVKLNTNINTINQLKNLLK